MKKIKRSPPKARSPNATSSVGAAAASPPGVSEISSSAEQLEAAGNRQAAIELYRNWLAGNESLTTWVIWFNLGVMLRNGGDTIGAIDAYENAIRINPLCIHARINIGTALETVSRADEAISHWRTALEQLDQSAEPPSDLLCAVLNNLGRRLEIAQRYTEAEAMLVRSLRINPGQDAVLYHRIYLRQKQCAWPIYDPLPGISEDDQRKATSAVAMLSITDDPAIQLQTARVQGPSKVAPNIRKLPPPAPYHHRRLRIGYLSSNFGMHAVSILTAELYELHDRSRVEVWGFCWSPEDNTEMRARVIGAMDHFVRIKDLTDEQAAQAIRDAEIDVLVDLQGLTAGCRPGIIAMRPAPVQVTYLGFPGTTGLPEIDYVLADRYIIPEESAKYFTEKPLYLPECFQVNDRKRESSAPRSREHYGLPKDAFVFCAFNNNIKFTPELFAAWMRILQRTPGSVLWLLADNDKARENLGRCADENGVTRDRLIFAPRVSVADYLGRFAAADLFLDLFPFNGGTTVADALWMACPVVTLSGRSFASRMAGSLLRNIGLPELVTETLQDYEDLAVQLADDKPRVKALRATIEANKTSTPIFDTPRLVAQIEDLFLTVTNSPATSSPMSTSTTPEEFIERGNFEQSGPSAKKRRPAAGPAKPDTTIGQTKAIARPFVIAAPVYDHHSAGIRVLHVLCNELNQCGYTAYLLFYQFKPEGGQNFYWSDDRTGYCPDHAFIKHFPRPTSPQIIRDCIDTGYIIYPEVIQGNPLAAPRVIRYILNNPDANKYPMYHSDYDYIISFHESYWKDPHFKLTILIDEPFFNDTDTLPAAKRTMDCTYIGKGSKFGECFKIPGSVLIERTWPADKESLAVMLKNSRYFYTWDVISQTNVDAVRCGAILVVIRWGTYSPDIFETDFGAIPYADIKIINSNLNIRIDHATYEEKRRIMLAGYKSRALRVSTEVEKFAESAIDYFCKIIK